MVVVENNNAEFDLLFDDKIISKLADSLKFKRFSFFSKRKDKKLNKFIENYFLMIDKEGETENE